MEDRDVYDHDKEMGFTVSREPDMPSSDWPMVICFLGLFTLVGFIVWILAR